MPTITYRTQREMLEAFDRQQQAEARERAAQAEIRLEREAAERKARRQRERQERARLEAEAVKSGCWAFTLPPYDAGGPAAGEVDRREPWPWGHAERARPGLTDHERDGLAPIFPRAQPLRG